MLKPLLIISCLLFLVGCRHDIKPPDPPVVITKFVAPDCGPVPKRDLIKLRSVVWEVTDGKFILSAKEYENLSFNVSVITKGIKQLQIEIEYYERCLEAAKPDVG